MNYNELTKEEAYYIEKAKKTGLEKGDCKELSDLCCQAYADCKAGIISKEAYRRIYAVCIDYAYPR